MITPPRRVVVRSSCLVAMLLGVGVEVRAQMPVPGGTGVTGMQSPAVFGGARGGQPGQNSVTLSTDVLAGYDTNIFLENVGGVGGGPVGSSEATDSTFAGASASLQWTQTRRRVAYFGGIDGSYRKYFDVDGFDLNFGGVSGGMSYQISPRQSFSLNGQAAITPFYQFGVIGGNVPGFGNSVSGGFLPDALAARELAFRYGAGANYQYALSERLSFDAQASRTGFEPFNDAADTAGLAALGGTSVGGRLRYGLTEKFGARAGYAYTSFDGVSTGLDAAGNLVTQQFRTHNIDVGIDYSDNLTIAPDTTFSFGTGTVMTQNSGGIGSAVQGPTFSVVGFAALTRQFLRTWNANINYNRSVAYIEVANGLGTFDSASASISGLFTDRIDASAGASYVRGAPFGVTSQPITNISAGAQVRYAFSTNSAAFVAYTFGYFDQVAGFGAAQPSFAAVPERHGIRFGVSFWTDLLH